MKKIFYSYSIRVLRLYAIPHPLIDVIAIILGACDVARNYLSDILEFLSDVHTLSKVKSNVKGMTVGLNEDTLGGTLKASLAQYLALEISIPYHRAKIVNEKPFQLFGFHFFRDILTELAVFTVAVPLPAF